MSGKESTDDLVSTNRVWPAISTTTPCHRSPSTFIFAAALSKLLLGPLSMVFAGMALLVDADMAKVGSGFWAGAVATAAGGIGVSVRNLDRVPIGFIAWTGLSLGSSALLIVLSGTGLAHDSMSVVRAWPPALAANAVLLTLATLDCLASIVALAVELSDARGRNESGNAADRRHQRLLHWLQTQRHLLDPVFNPNLHKPFKPLPHPQVYKIDSQIPTVIVAGPARKNIPRIQPSRIN